MAQAPIKIRPFEFNDFPQWLPLWNENNLGHINEPVTTSTWGRLMDEQSSVKGLAAMEGDVMAGFLHYILHPVTGHIEPACYMQDVYVSPAFRQKGIGLKLVRELADIGKKQKWARLYWLAEAQNEAAQALYKKIGVKLNFTLHVLPLS